MFGHGKKGKSKRTARMSVNQFACEYNMKHKNRGLAIIFNHENFELSLDPRNGTDFDCDNLQQTLKRLSFDVAVYKDLRYIEIREKLEEVSGLNHSENDCILICILSHGELGKIYAKDMPFKLDSIMTFFTATRCPTLASKPKLFFIQACQGDSMDGGVILRGSDIDNDQSMLVHTDLTLEMDHNDGQVNGTHSMQQIPYTIPIHADFLIAYSTIAGFYSWRNPVNGSPFVNYLCMELRLNGKKHDILTLLTSMIRRVAVEFESNRPNEPMMHKQKQIPCFTSMLTRQLRF